MTIESIIAEAEAAVAYGTVSLTIKKHDSEVREIDVTKVTRRRVDGNAQALTLVGSMLKLLHEAGDTGNLTFTITLNQGTAEQLMTQDFRRINMR